MFQKSAVFQNMVSKTRMRLTQGVGSSIYAEVHKVIDSNVECHIAKSHGVCRGEAAATFERCKEVNDKVEKYTITISSVSLAQ